MVNTFVFFIVLLLPLAQLARWARWPSGRLRPWRAASTSTCSRWTSTRSWWPCTAAVCYGRRTFCMRASRPSSNFIRSGLKCHPLNRQQRCSGLAESRCLSPQLEQSCTARQYLYLISLLFCLLLCQHLKSPPQSVVLVGHSMGGVVARALYTLPRFNPNLVDLIITQASPHLAPVLALDPFLLGRRSLPRVHLMGLHPQHCNLWVSNSGRQASFGLQCARRFYAAHVSILSGGGSFQ